ncbi:hypothetical protein QRX50_28650 [Amycolatopsis carbonis]|uniref:Uncharacterized protein n=1 Tax=Amycolatopsis carbonis TaxID=715471 RepID=A0A9Y2MUA9_9PSEU|nr:hypothetical protein [Amycolatopsis sp. 2-15]WIX75477.1 hypothetical protein QRX50_28650 [Amycolatopsis sp. 2-15]
MDEHGAVAYDSAGRHLIGFTRAGQQLSEKWKKELAPGQLLDVTCFGRCPRVALLIQDPAAPAGSRVEFADEQGRAVDTWASEANEPGLPLRVFRWRPESALFLRNRAAAVELVARHDGKEIVLRLRTSAAIVKTDPAGDSVVIIDDGRASVISTRPGGAWNLVRQFPTTATAACIAASGDRVLIAGDEDVVVEVPSGRLHRTASTLTHAGACALAGDWTVTGSLGTVNGAPRSEWVARQSGSQSLWRSSYRQLGDVFMAPSGGTACIAFAQPVCRTARGAELTGITGSVVQDAAGQIVYLADDGSLRQVS